MFFRGRGSHLVSNFERILCTASYFYSVEKFSMKNVVFCDMCLSIKKEGFSLLSIAK